MKINFTIKTPHNLVRFYRTGDEIDVKEGKALITSIAHVHVKQGHIEIKGICRLKEAKKNEPRESAG